jgi:hypothetical protein
MFVVARVLVFAGLLSFPIVATAQSASNPVRTPALEDASVAHTPEEFAGQWSYNAAESVNAATGRRERAPRSATQRGAATAPTGGRGGASSSSGGEAASGEGGGRGRRGGGGGGAFMTPEMMRETRNLSRDLLEIPEALTIRVTADAISFTDDIERTRTYPTTGVKQKYQLGAARFDAAVEWSRSRLNKKIEGPYGFRMTETYFLSSDARRLFIIIRIGEPKKDEPIVGFNRVYDRVDVQPPS